MNAVTTTEPVSAQTLEHVLGSGDLSKLTTHQRVEYYAKTCQTLGLNPLTRPFRFLSLNGQIQLYATRDCTDQLRKVHGITLHVVDKQIDGDLFIVTVRARTKDGREDEDIGAVTLGRLQGESRANALMKGLTKAKRRVTLSVCGLGLTDESELDTMPGVMAFDADAPPPAPIVTQRAPSPRDAINAEVPLKPHPQMPTGPVDPNPVDLVEQPKRMTWGQLLKSFEMGIHDAQTAEEIQLILRSPQMAETKAHISRARSEHQQKFEELMIMADARLQELTQPADDDEAPTIVGEELINAG